MRLDRGFDVIGSVAIIKPKPDDSPGKTRAVAAQIMRENKHIASIFIKSGKVEGEDRTMKLRWVAGSRKSLTLHRENGFVFYVDVRKVFFSPRMGTERLRVINQVKPGDRVLDMFCGVGPFAIPIAKKASYVYAIDINKKAIALLKKNIKLNKITNIDFKQGDSNKLAGKLGMKFDRIIMNFPSNPTRFLGSAVKAAADRCVVYYYKFINASDRTAIKDENNKIRGIIGKDFTVTGINTFRAGETAPFVNRMCFQIRLRKNQ